MVAEKIGVDPRQLRRVAFGSSIGTTVEWYDFFIFSTAVPIVFNTQFFSTLSPASGTLAGFATLGVGILARPVGGVIWGHFGDRVGRKTMLVASLLVMGARDGRRRPVADLRADRGLGSDPAGGAAARPGHLGRR